MMIMSILTAVAAPTFFDSLLFHRVETAARRYNLGKDKRQGAPAPAVDAEPAPLS